VYYRVVIRNNLVCSIDRLEHLNSRQRLLATNLEAGAAIARHNLENGRIDGEYCFGEFEQAKAFAMLSLEFIEKSIEAKLTILKRLDYDEEFNA